MESGSVVDLSDSSFLQMLQEGGMWVVMFSAPWCTHCTQSKPHFAQAAVEYAQVYILFFLNISCLSFSLFRALSLSLSLSLYLFRKIARSLSIYLFLFFSHAHTHSVTHSLTCPLTQSLSSPSYIHSTVSVMCTEIFAKL